MESAVIRIQPPELESRAIHSHLQERISLKLNPANETRVCVSLYPAARTKLLNPTVRTKVSWRMESAAARIQSPELESAVGWSQP